jgi:hypothetical protein
MPVSVKDRWIAPPPSREQALNIPIACRIYKPVKPSSWLSIETWFFPHCFIGCYGREAGCGPADGSASMLWVGSEALLLESSGSVQICCQLRERFLCVDCVRCVWSRIIHGLSVGCVWRGGRVSPAGYTSI